MDFLEKLAYIVCLIGFLSLFFAYFFYSPEELSFTALQSLESGDFSYAGNISALRESQNILYIDIQSTCHISGVHFSDDSAVIKDLNTSIGKRIFVSGHLDSYKGKKQYVFDEIYID